MPVNLNELALQTKQSKMLRSSLLYSPGAILRPENISLKKYVKEGFTKNPVVYSCIALKQATIGHIPVDVYDIRTDEPVKTENPFVTLVKRPNPQESWPQFVSHIVGDLDSAGNVFIERVGPEMYEKTRPRELYCVPPVDMDIKRGNIKNPVEEYTYAGDVHYKPWQIRHIKYYNPLDYFWGLSPINACFDAVMQNNAAAEWNYALFSNSARPSGILTLSDEVIDETSFDDIVKKIKAQYSGAANAGNVMVLTGDMRWTTTSFTPTDMDYNDMMTQNIRRIASCFQVPVQLINEETAQNRSNYIEARQMFYKETVIPMLDWILKELNNWLVPLFGGNYEIRYDPTAIEAIQEDTNERYDRILRAVAGGVLTPNEGRQVLGYGKMEGTADERLIPWNLAPESRANNPNQALMMAGQGGPAPGQPLAGRPSQDTMPTADGNREAKVRAKNNF